MLFLIEYDRSNGSLVSIQDFPDSQRRRAEEARLARELDLRQAGREREVVVLEAANRETLRRTHRRYFEAIHDLARSMEGFIVVEPDLSVERVPDRLSGWEAILWPASKNSLPEKQPGTPVEMINPRDLYFRHTLAADGTIVFVSPNRDPEALPAAIIGRIRQLARSEAAPTSR